MTKLNQIYRCNICGNIVEVVHAGGGTLVCCGQEMKQMEENSVDAAREKHVPVLEKTTQGFKVRVGEIAHPMEEAHYIEWIEIIVDGRFCRKYLKSGEEPEADFCAIGETIEARTYCNLHGLWKNEK